ncbi:ABC transporter permease [uncultured Jatrophihabitans sp.]|uniref:ABC transporter permease n=1 Tax=uncultured Jatrophihabitans sp. TaxID=1610747 RepID=UPI0035CA55D4
MNGKTIKGILKVPSGLIGTIVLVAVLAIALLGPLFTPHSITAIVGTSSAPPGHGFLLGTDFLGRDVLSRVLAGGRSVIGIGFAATVLAYLVGVTIGLFAGYRGGTSDAIAMRVVDVFLAFPPLLLLLLLIGGLGQHIWVLIVSVIFALAPPIARVTRTATQSVSKQSYVEAAQARGDSTLVIWRGDILPNIMHTILADFGIRFAVSILLVASLNYLGLGLTPPAADWGLMTSENQATFILNPAAVVAPAVMLALLTISINLIADAYIRVVGGRVVSRRRRRRAGATPVATPPLHALKEVA